MESEASVVRWCGVCGTAHAGPKACPGDLRATGAERLSWRVNVQTPTGPEAIAVLLAPSHGVWRARIATLPNVLWTMPGGRGTIKFVGDTREEAEARAVAFVEQHLRAMRHLHRDATAPVGGPVPVASVPSPGPVFTTAPRKLKSLPVRYGADRAAQRGMTLNLSAEGMFIGVPTPEAGGRSLLINLDVEGHTVPLRGLVMWNRRRQEPGRPLGMGIRLSEPPPLYRKFVASLP